MKCPTCRRVGEPDDESCRRCGTDFLLLRQAARTVDKFVDRGYRCLCKKSPDMALQNFNKSRSLSRRSGAAVKGIALSYIMKKNYSAALSTYLYYRSIIADGNH